MNSFYAIGDPGRAALEVSAGPPPARIGPSDVELSSAEVPGMVIRAASSRGILHRRQFTVRQDAFALGRRAMPGEAEMAIVVVCDGVGSLERSDDAAMLVSRRLAELGAAGVSWPDAFCQVNAELRKYAVAGSPAAGAAGDGLTVDGAAVDMATTAVAVRAWRDGADWVGEVAWVGDSSFWHLDDRGNWRLLAPPLEDEVDGYHSGQVRPLPSADGEWSAAGFQLPGGALFLMTDGVANPLQWSPDVRDTLARWWGQPPDPFTFAAQVGFARRTHMDDRTVVGIWSMHDARQQDQPGQPGRAF